MEMHSKLFRVIYEDEELLVIDKPAGLVCHPTKTDEYSSLAGRVRLHLGPGHEAHLVNRLDRETSGIVVAAKTPQAARTLGKSWESRLVEKEYLAVVHGALTAVDQLIDAPLGKDIQSRVVIKDTVLPNGTPAQTIFNTVRSFEKEVNGEPAWFSLVHARPLSGRKHQIRIHLAHLGHPVVGDKIYGPDEGIYLAFVENRITEADWRKLILPHHALCAVRVAFPWQGGVREFTTSPEEWFRSFAPDK